MLSKGNTIFEKSKFLLKNTNYFQLKRLFSQQFDRIQGNLSDRDFYFSVFPEKTTKNTNTLCVFSIPLLKVHNLGDFLRKTTAPYLSFGIQKKCFFSSIISDFYFVSSLKRIALRN
jgi:hypothetical protein